ncbi:mannose-6-phosphate isomerase [Conyzicola lurida]|uniref:mannose-6-phosphate isomerase n=1 Tax=Conyzicola lurida TaxID=1172621 RepID=A0A841AJX2_9MICO|nr:mannose-6-phosphate isomerase, class I [Conyzicola lurida]MBB5844210.1 mannose-6-phosphate isomerase [Conyzicola lurida]
MFVGITNTPRDYAWGSTTAIAELLGTPPSGGPEAELWLGAHPGSPARLTDGSGTVLDILDERLPFLLKVLAAAAPLSLQAHPTMAQAADGFARENALGIPLDAADRNYKDEFHKPELIYALTDGYRALCGFRPVSATAASIARLLGARPGDPALSGWSARLESDDDLRATFEWLVSGGDDVVELVEAVVAAASGIEGEHFTLVGELAAAYPGDPGIVVSLMLNLVTLQRGEVLYLPAGNIHAYVEGLGIELMAASDNVLRGGLTPKHIDVPELLSVLDFSPVPVPYLAPETTGSGIAVYRPDVPDFVLAVVTGPVKDAAYDVGGTGIVLCTAGSFTLTGALSSVSVTRGESVLVTADEATLTISGDGDLFIAGPGQGLWASQHDDSLTSASGVFRPPGSCL